MYPFQAPIVPTRWPTNNLDPEPYVDGHYDVAGNFRRFAYEYPTPDHCQACGTRFAPRPEYEQDRNKYPLS